MRSSRASAWLRRSIRKSFPLHTNERTMTPDNASAAATAAAASIHTSTTTAAATKNKSNPVYYGHIDGPIAIIGFGSIGRGTLPLIQRHFSCDELIIIEPKPIAAEFLLSAAAMMKNKHATTTKPKTHLIIRHQQVAVTKENYRDVLEEIFGDESSGKGSGIGFCVNLSVDTSSLDLMTHCRKLKVLYIDTVVEPWAGYYDDASNTDRTNYTLRQAVRDAAASSPGGTTAVSCCGANPGMVSWFVKEALMTMANDLAVVETAATPTTKEIGQEDKHASSKRTGSPTSTITPSAVPASIVAVTTSTIRAPIECPTTRLGWARLMQSLGVKGVHIAERDTQVRHAPRPKGVFVNTWSVEGFIAEGLQPAELGWGTHETWMPPNANQHETGCMAGIWLNQPGAMTRVHSWCPTPGPQFGYLVTHNEAISISDYYTVESGNKAAPNYRPTCHYAYHPCDDAVLSLHEMFGSGRPQDTHDILHVDEIVDGMDELGVLLYGHAKNALWYGSRLTNAEACTLAPFQNATGLQVSSAVLAGMVWALEHPNAGIVEADEMDHARCLQVQRPYLGPVEAHYTDWTPLMERCWTRFFPEEVDEDDPWQFRNVLAS